jgi:hypothetical protein
MKAVRRGRRRASLPKRRIPTTGIVPQPDPVAVPPPGEVESGMFSEGMSTEHAFTSGQPHDVATASPSNNIRGGKRVRRRSVNCILRLCCCVRAQNSQPQFHNAITPKEAVED